MIWQRTLAVAFSIAALLEPATATAHETPYSFVDLRLRPDGIEGTLTAHVDDIAHDLGIPDPKALLDATRAAQLGDSLAALFAPRLELRADRHTVFPRWGMPRVDRERQGLTVPFRVRWVGMPGTLDLQARLFPYDPQHETYLNVYESDSLAIQELLDRRHDRARLHGPGRGGKLVVIQTFVSLGSCTSSSDPITFCS